MKKISLFAILLCFGYVSLAQKDKTHSGAKEGWTIFTKAMEFADYEVARNGLYQVIAYDSENKAVYDSLAHLYFLAGAYEQCIKAAERTANPDGNIPLRDIRAYSLRNMGDFKGALAIFEKLWTDLHQAEYGYQAAVTQYSLKRYGESMETISAVIALPEAKSKQVIISTDEGKSLSVSYLAAGLNLKGVIYLEMNQPEKAKEALESALSASPDFTLAKNNLESVNKKLQK